MIGMQSVAIEIHTIFRVFMVPICTCYHSKRNRVKVLIQTQDGLPEVQAGEEILASNAMWYGEGQQQVSCDLRWKQEHASCKQAAHVWDYYFML
jgi:hypothetical protein